MRCACFTFFELLVVTVVIVLVAALILPRVGRTPARLEQDSALAGIRQAVNETSTRARVTGKALELVLDMENSAFIVRPISDGIPQARPWVPPLSQSDEVAENTAVAVASCESYSLSNAIEWHPEETGLDLYDAISFSFYEDGQAAGQPLRFTIGKFNYQMDVDKLTGDPLIQEFD